jgi:hypothetical protein
MLLLGHCHCGNLRIQFESTLEPAALPLRACQCSFCRRHGAVSTSDPKGAVRVAAGDLGEVQRYRFGLGITDFLLCRRCGVYVLALAEMDGQHYAVINANSLERREEMRATPEPMAYDGESAEARRARRKAHWTPVAALPGWQADAR